MYVNIDIKKHVKHIVFIVALSILVIGAAIASINMTFNSTDSPLTDSVELPIIMYHGIIKEQKLQGRFVISPNTFESDLKYLKENGFNTIFVQDLIDYVYNNTPLPEKPIMITFDDGYYNNYLYAFPLVKKYNSKMVLSPIGYFTDKYSEIPDTHASYAHVTWDNINEMVDSGLVEIQNHSYNLHSNKKSRKGAQKIKSESVEHYKNVLEKDLSTMQDKALKYTGKAPTAFVYPFGAVSEISLDILKQMGFKSTLICESRINHITKDPKCLYNLGRYIRTNKPSSPEFFGKIIK